MNFYAERLKASDPGVQVDHDLPRTISARELQTAIFPPVSWIVADLLPEGLTLFAGKPKLGKSWMALHLGYAVATGGDFLGRAVTQSDVLYAALEDNDRRLKARIAKMAPDEDWPQNYRLCTEWPRLDAGGLEALERYHDNRPDCRLMIVDTLATVRPASKSSDSQYTGDYGAMRGLHALANERGLGLIVIHHVRKAEADDPFDTVSGSTGLTGAADTTLILTKNSEGTVLYGRGRDLAETETAVSFDPDRCRWSDLGLPSLAFASDTRAAIIKAMQTGAQTPAKIAEVSGINPDLTRQTLVRMFDGGDVIRDRRGCYSLPRDPLSQQSQCHNEQAESDNVTGVTGFPVSLTQTEKDDIA